MQRLQRIAPQEDFQTPNTAYGDHKKPFRQPQSQRFQGRNSAGHFSLVKVSRQRSDCNHNLGHKSVWRRCTPELSNPKLTSRFRSTWCGAFHTSDSRRRPKQVPRIRSHVRSPRSSSALAFSEGGLDHQKKACRVLMTHPTESADFACP